jgi:hypothetical protein
MPNFIAESYLPRSRRADAASLAERARQAAETLAGTGREVVYLRSAFLPDDELCLHWFAASSSAVVAEVASLAALEWDRVVEAVE